MTWVSQHAIERYRERFGGLSDDEARSALLKHSEAIGKAAWFGCSRLKCGDMTLALDGDSIINVLFSRKPEHRGGVSRAMSKRWFKAKTWRDNN